MCPVSVCTNPHSRFSLLKSQILMVLSLEPDAKRPSFNSRTDHTGAVCPVNSVLLPSNPFPQYPSTISTNSGNNSLLPTKQSSSRVPRRCQLARGTKEEATPSMPCFSDSSHPSAATHFFCKHGPAPTVRRRLASSFSPLGSRLPSIASPLFARLRSARFSVPSVTRRSGDWLGRLPWSDILKIDTADTKTYTHTHTHTYTKHPHPHPHKAPTQNHRLATTRLHCAAKGRACCRKSVFIHKAFQSVNSWLAALSRWTCPRRQLVFIQDQGASRQVCSFSSKSWAAYTAAAKRVIRVIFPREFCLVLIFKNKGYFSKLGK